MTVDYLSHFKKNDLVMAKIVSQVGPYTIKLTRHRNLYRPLMESVVYQQLAGQAASAILKRFVGLYPESDFPTDEEVLNTPITKLRSAGLSQAKSLAILDIAKKSVEGIIPPPRDIKKLSDDEIIERLTQIRGVGPWTVHMLLIKLGRPDILPVTDYGIRKAFSLAYKKRSLPTPKQLIKHAEAWRPYRSVASWYLWRTLD